MTQLKTLDDETLLKEIKRLVREERELLTKILHHLREIDRRRLYSKLKFPSLYEYCMNELSYSKDQAYRRIQAMHLLKEIPMIEEKINSGSLSLTHITMARTLFKREENNKNGFSRERKLEIIEKLEDTTTREAEKIIFSFSPSSMIPEDKIRAVSTNDFEFKFVGSETLLKKIQKLKGILAHKNPKIKMAELLDLLCDLGLEKWDKSRSQQSPTPSQNITPPRVKENSLVSTINQPVAAPQKTVTLSVMSKAEIHRQIWRQGKGQCENCGSQYAIEIDHRYPKAAGGSNSIENLRLLCRACNQRAAIEFYGLDKMEKSIAAPRKV